MQAEQIWDYNKKNIELKNSSSLGFSQAGVNEMFYKTEFI